MDTLVVPVRSVPQRSRARRLVEPLGLGAATLSATVALHLRDPHVQGSWGVCPLKLITGGLDCPACGGLRAVNDLTNLDLGAALSSNALFVVLIPVLVIAWIAWVRRAWRGPDAAAAQRTGLLALMRRYSVLPVAFFTMAVVFAVVRNLPFASWLAS